MVMRLQGSHQLPVDMWKMIDEPPRAPKSTLSTAHNLYILSPPEQKEGQCSALKQKEGGEGLEKGARLGASMVHDALTRMAISEVPPCPSMGCIPRLLLQWQFGFKK